MGIINWTAFRSLVCPFWTVARAYFFATILLSTGISMISENKPAGFLISFGIGILIWLLSQS